MENTNNSPETGKVLSQKKARTVSTIPHKKAKNDKDVLHDVETLKMLPKNDNSHTIISTKRKSKKP